MAKRAEWTVLRGTLVVFVLSLAVSAGMVSASFYFRQNMEREYQVHHGEFREASRKYLAVDDEERIIVQFFPEFRRLYERGLLGGERSLSWLEALRRAGDDIGIKQVSYKLDAQREATPDFNINLGNYQLYASAMSLSLELAHEGDLHGSQINGIDIRDDHTLVRLPANIPATVLAHLRGVKVLGQRLDLGRLPPRRKKP